MRSVRPEDAGGHLLTSCHIGSDCFDGRTARAKAVVNSGARGGSSSGVGSGLNFAAVDE
jgi:hypothetical protein